MTYTTHFNASGEAHMVDVGTKAITQRIAITEGYIKMRSETLQMISAGEHKKGDVLAVARIAGIMAAKKTADLIPLCHPLPITHIEINLSAEPEQNRIRCETTVKTIGQTFSRLDAVELSAQFPSRQDEQGFTPITFDDG